VLTASITAKYTATSSHTCGPVRMADSEVTDLRLFFFVQLLAQLLFLLQGQPLDRSKLSGKHLSTTSPSRITGVPSMTNIHCQPRRPPKS
jgi:hypothetical protein